MTTSTKFVIENGEDVDLFAEDEEAFFDAVCDLILWRLPMPETKPATSKAAPPTAGAMRAAREIFAAQCDVGRTFDNSLNAEQMAGIIDRETGAEMLEALEAIKLKIGMASNAEIYSIAQTAIRKARGQP